MQVTLTMVGLSLLGMFHVEWENRVLLNSNAHEAPPEDTVAQMPIMPKCRDLGCK